MEPRMENHSLKAMRPSPLMPNRVGSAATTTVQASKSNVPTNPVYASHPTTHPTTHPTAFPVESNSQSPYNINANSQAIPYSTGIQLQTQPQTRAADFGPTTTSHITRSAQNDNERERYVVPANSQVGVGVAGTTSSNLALNSSVLRSQNINHSLAESHAKKTATNTPLRASPLMAKVASSAINPPDRHTPNVTSSFAGKIVPAERPYAFTTVTYAKTNPMGTQKAMLNESYARQYAATDQVGTRATGGSSSCTTSTVSRARHRVQQRNPGGNGRRFAKREGGVCGTFNEKVCCGVFDSTGGCCGCLNCGGCCDRPQNIPMDIQYAPQPY